VSEQFVSTRFKAVNVVGLPAGTGYTVIAAIPNKYPLNQDRGFLLAMSTDGRGYATWAYEETPNNGLHVFWGHYFDRNTFDAFQGAVTDLEHRASGE
jgi:hypothetical protein